MNVFPSQIEEALLSFEGIAPHYQIVVDRANNTDNIEVWVEVVEGMFTDEMKKMVEMEKALCDKLYAMLNIRVKVKLVDPRTIERSQGKANGSSTSAMYIRRVKMLRDLILANRSYGDTARPSVLTRTSCARW